MRSLAAAQVVDSLHPDYKAGDYVTGWFGWQDYAAVPADKIVQRTAADELTQSLGILGLNGVTAYMVLTLVGKTQAGETVLVSSSDGYVGSEVGQIDKLFD